MKGTTVPQSNALRGLAGQCLIFALTALVASAGAAAEPDALAIMERNFHVVKARTLRNTATMTLIASDGATRERKVDIVAKRQPNGADSKIVIRFQYPPDIKGTGFLQIEKGGGDDSLWIYLPALNKSRRLVASNKKDSFFGTDFAYGDILPPRVGLFRHAVVGSALLEGIGHYVVESTLIDEDESRNSGYRSKKTWVRKDNFLESRIEYLDGSGRLIKTQTVGGHRLIDADEGKWIATRREMTNHDSGHRTVLDIGQIDANRPIAEEYFTVRTLERDGAG